MSDPIKNRYEFVVLFETWKTAIRTVIPMRAICRASTPRPAMAL